MSDVAIRIEGLGKRYRLGEREPYHALRDVAAGAFARSLTAAGALARRSSGRRPAPRQAHGEDAIWALRNVDLEIKAGEAVGIIGRNGAGKSTLLKILSRITEPTEGLVELCGSVGSLLEVGTCFHPELTGRENMFFNGAILGMQRAEIKRRFDEIVAFAGVEPFVDTPVKHYSSGMQMRLAFAVAAHLQPEILLVDEVLAVGDAEFQRKCLGKIGEVAGQGRTVLFVSHNLGAITRLCPRAAWLESGRVALTGPADSVLAAYLGSHTALSGARSWAGGFANPGVEEFRLQSAAVLDAQYHEASTIDVRSDFFIEIIYCIVGELPYLRVGFILAASDGTAIFEAYDSDNREVAGRRLPGEYVVRCRVPGRILQPGPYFLTINAGMPNITNLAYVDRAIAFEIEDTETIGLGIAPSRSGVIRPSLDWSCKAVALV